jgi:triosephosphate isomerase
MPGPIPGEVLRGDARGLRLRWVIIGHSERRQYHDESDALVAAKLAAAQRAA